MLSAAAGVYREANPRLAFRVRSGDDSSMNVEDLLQPAYVKPVLITGSVAMVAFFLAWWPKAAVRHAWPLMALAVSWITLHAAIHPLSYLWPPRQGIDWLVFAAAAMLAPALLAWAMRKDGPCLMVAVSILLGAGFWFALKQMPYLLARTESPDARLNAALAGMSGVILTFYASEWAARRISPSAFLAGLGLFCFSLALGLLSMASGERLTGMPLAAGSLAFGAAIAAVICGKKAVLTPGMAGWLAGGPVILFTWGCLSRASDVPVWPIAGALAACPLAAAVLGLFTRIFRGGRGLALIAALLAASAGVLALSLQKPGTPPSGDAEVEFTGADDTGAYDEP